MKVAFREDLDAAAIEDVTNRVEARIRGKLPQMRKIFIEVDSRGDGRGLAPLRKLVVAAKAEAGAMEEHEAP
jgi:hypothetical protein